MVALRAVALLALSGCTLITDSFLTNDFSGDAFPIDIDTSSGAIVVGMRRADRPDEADHQVVLDLLSPITVVDPGVRELPSVTFTDLTLLGRRGGDGAFDLPRARFVEAQLVSIHPCALDDETCQVGEGTLLPFTGVIGADALAGDAVRLRLGEQRMFVLPDIGGSSPARSLDCDAVFNSPYRGGGTQIIGGTELPFGNRRIVIDACLGYAQAPPLPATTDAQTGQQWAIPLRQGGTDVTLVATTSIGISILNESAYARYAASDPDAVPADGSSTTVYLPSGPITGRRATISRLALISSATTNPVRPCRQVHAHHLFEGYVPKSHDECADRGKVTRRVDDMELPAIDCPCDNGNRFCDVPAIVELAAQIDILVVPDSDRTLQALRTELRPDQPEIDGLLGTNALTSAEVDVDYPHDRLLARCAGAGCLTRPALSSERQRCQINHCISGTSVKLGCDE